MRAYTQSAQTGSYTLSLNGSQTGSLEGGDPPPSGVGAQLGWATPGPSNCGVVETQPTLFMPSPRVVSIPSEYIVCLWGFSPNKPIEISVTGPNGTVEQEQIPDAQAPWRGHVILGNPTGTYTVVARQVVPPVGLTRGILRQATISFSVVRATRQSILVVPKEGIPGTTFQVHVAGFSPDERVPLHVYRLIGTTDRRWEYVTTIPAAAVNRQGEAIRNIRTQRGDPPGRYIVAYGSNPVGFYLSEGPRVFIVNPGLIRLRRGDTVQPLQEVAR